MSNPISPRRTLGAVALTLATLSAGTAAQAIEPFIGEIRTFGFNFCPRGWAAADGQLLSISENSALFSLFGTYYGGDGRTTFGLPDLRGRSVMHHGQGPGLSPRTIGARGGQETVTLTQSEMPSHAHDVLIAGANQNGGGTGIELRENADISMASGGTGNAGGGQPHNNMPPFLVMNTCVALVGLYPSRN